MPATEGKKSSNISNTDILTMHTDNLRITDSTKEKQNFVDLDEEDGSDEEVSRPITSEVTVKRIAKKSTATPEIKHTAAVTRRQVALANIKKNNSHYDKFMENFDPECSARERRKLNRKVNAVNNITRKIPGAVYDDGGIHIASGIDLCDCLQKACTGCHFPCPKCKSPKCGPECRCNRKYVYDQIEYHGCDLIVKNPLNK